MFISPTVVSLGTSAVAHRACDEGRGLKRESIRKQLLPRILAQVLDFAKVTPNPARDGDVKLPADDTEEVNPSTADHVAAAYTAMTPRTDSPC